MACDGTVGGASGSAAEWYHAVTMCPERTLGCPIRQAARECGSIAAARCRASIRASPRSVLDVETNADRFVGRHFENVGLRRNAINAMA